MPSELPRAVLPSQANASGGPGCSGATDWSNTVSAHRVNERSKAGMARARSTLRMPLHLRGACEAESMHELDLLILSPLGDGRVSPRAAHDGTTHQGEDGWERVSPAVAAA